MPIPSRSHLSDAVLLRQVFDHTAREAAATAEHLADLAEIDARRAFAPAAYSSMFDFCVRGLHLTRDEARLRIRLGRLCRQIPLVLDAIADGRLRLTAVGLLAARLTPDNAAGLIAAAAHQTLEELREMLAARFPKPDVPERCVALDPAPDVQALSGECVSKRVQEPVGVAAASADGDSLATFTLVSPESAAPAGPRAKVEPLSAERFAVQCTVARTTFEKLGYVKALLGHGAGAGDLATVLDRALDALARELERRKYGITDRPRQVSRPSTNPRHIPAAVKRAVVARDQGQCSFVSDDGCRCQATDRLEFDHAVPVARGGTATVDNVRLRCRTHNQLEAEREFGAEFVRGKREATREAATERKRAAATRRAAEAERDRAASEAQARSAAEREQADAEARARTQAIEAVIPYLRALGIRKDQARAAAQHCEGMAGASLEERVKHALRCYSRPRPVAGGLPAHPVPATAAPRAGC